MRSALKLLFAAVVVLGVMTAAAADQTISWVSVTADGSVNGAVASPVAVSDDGRFVAFESNTNGLVPGDSDGLSDIFVKDMQTGALEIVSVSSGGAIGNAPSGFSTIDISNDGRYVLFDSDADNLVAGDTNDGNDMFIHDRQAATTERIPRDDGGEPSSAADGSLSGNGRYVSFAGAGFESAEAANFGGMYVFDRQTETIDVISDGTDFPSGITAVRTGISDDGRFVVFRTGEFNGAGDLILFDRDSRDWEVANPRMGDVAPITAIQSTSISGNGRFVTFASPDDNYVSGDTAGTHDVFVYDSTTDTLERIEVGAQTSADPKPALSDDGRYVVFSSQFDLYDADPNGYPDVVVYDRDTDTGEVVSVFDDGSPANNVSGSYAWKAAISGDGRYVAFLTSVSFDPDDSAFGDYYIVDREGTTTAPPGGECTHDFTDVDGSNIFEADICWLADQGITRGCNPPANTEFCPTESVTRGQMAAFLVRALGYSDDGGGDLFTDDDGLVFEADIDRLGTAGVTRGCNPPENSRFCPGDNVTRGQMAAFLVRALGYSDDGGGDLFTDDDGLVFEADIDRLGTAGVTRGCNPPENSRFCPGDNVTRQQMAAFLRRALEG